MSELKIEALSRKVKGKNILDNISLTFEKGHSYGIFGRNGSGKTTLYNCIMQRVPFTGKITLDGKSTANDSALSKVFYAGAVVNYPKDFSIKTILKFSSALVDTFDSSYADELIAAFGLNRKTKFGSLSTGEETLLKDVLALASGCDYVILDEPDLGVDVNSRELLHKELSKRISEEKSCYIITTHLIEEISMLLENMIIIDNGQLLLNVNSEALYGGYHMLSGEISEVNAIASGYEIIGSEDFGRYRRTIIKTNEPSFENDKVKVDIISMQDLFRYMTGGKKYV